VANIEEVGQKQLDTVQILWSWLVQLWILAAVSTFLVIRLFGSNLAQRFLSGIKQHLFP
jgi:hypothetical protein